MTEARAMLDLAARLAMRAAGYVEPNPMVGAVIVRDGVILGMGHHMKYGGLHAEREALADCRRHGHDPRGATVYVTLEPCRHTGKQPPCTDALIQAGVARVVCARPDPGRESGGGAGVLRAAGIPCEFTDASPAATRLSDPFFKRVTTGLPWIIVKWAQTIDGKIAARTGESKWISGPLMRRRVHRLRARVDGVLVGAGTARADDPSLTARDVRIRRIATRIVLCSRWDLPTSLQVIQTSRTVPTIVVGAPPGADLEKRAVASLQTSGVETLLVPGGSGTRPDLRRMLACLADSHGMTNILVEGGAVLTGALFDAGLVDEARVHIAPMVLGDRHARSAAEGREAHSLAAAARLILARVRRLGDELELVYRRP